MKTVKCLLLAFGVIMLFSLSSSYAADPVPLPCDPAKDCPPVDPCKINPDRCKDKGGPIEKQQIEDGSNYSTAPQKEERDPCDWCKPCSKTPGSSCLSCCAGK